VHSISGPLPNAKLFARSGRDARYQYSTQAQNLHNEQSGISSGSGQAMDVASRGASRVFPTHSAGMPYVLGLLVALNVVSMLDRQILTILVRPIQDELAISDTAMGLLAGLSFASVSLLAGLPVRRTLDRSRRASLNSVLRTRSLERAHDPDGLGPGFRPALRRSHGARRGSNDQRRACALSALRRPSPQSVAAERSPSSRLRAVPAWPLRCSRAARFLPQPTLPASGRGSRLFDACGQRGDSNESYSRSPSTAAAIR
jgi:hypothetical protein